MRHAINGSSGGARRVSGGLASTSSPPCLLEGRPLNSRSSGASRRSARLLARTARDLTGTFGADVAASSGGFRTRKLSRGRSAAPATARVEAARWGRVPRTRPLLRRARLPGSRSALLRASDPVRGQRCQARLRCPSTRGAMKLLCASCHQPIAFLVDRAGDTAEMCKCGIRRVERRVPTTHERTARRRENQILPRVVRRTSPKS